MAFWGVEVKPGRPVTHSFDRVKGRLRVSQATLGFGSSTQKSVLQCNVGVKAPVLLCVLLPDKTESCNLDIEFEESEDVIFSVIGPRSVYLTGYYVGNSRHSVINDDTESYGEDIEHTDREESNHTPDEDMYEDSFIDDDDDVEAFPSFPIPSDQVDEKVACTKNKKCRIGNQKRLRKKYQSVESDEDENNFNNEDDEDILHKSAFPKKSSGVKNVMMGETEKDKGNKQEEGGKNHIVKSLGKADIMLDEGEANSLEFYTSGPKSIPTEEGENPEDGQLISSLLKKRSVRKNIIAVDTKKDNHNKRDAYGGNHFVELQGKEDVLMLKEGEAKSPERVPLEEGGNNGDTDIVPQVSSLPKKRSREEDIMEGERDKVNRNKREEDGGNHVVKSQVKASVVLKESDAKSKNGNESKRKKRKVSKETGSLTVDAVNDCNKNTEKNCLFETESKASSKEKNAILCGEQNQKQATNELQSEDVKPSQGSEELDTEHNVNRTNIPEGSHVKNDRGKMPRGDGELLTISEEPRPASVQCSIEIDPKQSMGEFQTDKERKKKKKRKGKTLDGQINVDERMPFLMKEEHNKSVMNADVKDSNANLTLSNDVIIEEIEMGDTDGKKAVLGKKVKVHYVGKLKESGCTFDTNLDKPPLKFRLGEAVLRGWDIGINGMHIGGKRRLIIPPSMGYGSDGAGENVPPNSWLVYDIKLVGLR